MRNQDKQLLAMCKPNKFCVFDRESTSFQANAQYGKLLELGAVIIEDGVVVDRIDIIISPDTGDGFKVPRKITELTGITNEIVEKEGIHYTDALKKFFEFAGDLPLIGHNVFTDVNYVKFWAEKIGIIYNPKVVIDTLKLHKIAEEKKKLADPFHISQKRASLDTLCKYYGVKLDGHHRADVDAEATASVFLKIRGILLPEIEALVLNESETLFNENYSSQNITPKENLCLGVVVLSVNRWRKEGGKVPMDRAYIRLQKGELFANVFFDYVKESWGVKDTAFNLPSNLREIDEIIVSSKGFTILEFKERS